jgi:hypothetical protein
MFRTRLASWSFSVFFVYVAVGPFFLYRTGILEAAEPPLRYKSLDSTLEDQFATVIQPLLNRFCFECHEGQAAESSVDLSAFKSLDSVRRNPSQWDQIRGVVRIGAMPPADSTIQPTEDEREQISQWTYRALHAFDCSEPNPPAPVTVRRLNSAEYDNTIRDLFHLEISPSKTIGFVSDDVGNGFDNQGEVLSISPLIFEKYSNAAEWISQQVIELDPNKLREQSADGDPIRIGESFTASFLFAEGEYEIRTRLRFGRRQDDSVTAEIYVDDDLLETIEVPAKGESFQWKAKFAAGLHQLRIRFAKDSNTKSEPTSAISIDQLSVKGPREGSPPMPLHHQKLLVAKPSQSLSSRKAATAVLERLLPKAFRRPISSQELARILGVFEVASEKGATYEESIQFAIQAILVSPEFLFRLEPSNDRLLEARQANGLDATKPAPLEWQLDDYELATRLSYFLWSSMPDDRLFELAKANRLSKPDVLQEEITRMLESPKADALVAGFFDQWLGIRNLQTVSVDENTFPHWSDRLSEAISKETFLFCQEMLRNGSLRDLLEADFTFVNPRLADFYDLPFDGQDPSEWYLGSSRSSEYARRLGNYRDENRWIRVELPDYRRGLLTQASILTLTSNPTRTSPVKRGKWVLENILGDPPPPAPPGVPPLDEDNANNKNRTLREQLEIHRANPSCASCHRVLDPIGLGLENFNAIGNWRTTDDGAKINAAGEFADGRTFSGPRELLKHLQVEQPKIARHFASQLLTYALGRGLTRGDSCTIDSIVDQASKDDLRVATFISAIVHSKPFRYVGVAP